MTYPKPSLFQACSRRLESALFCSESIGTLLLKLQHRFFHAAPVCCSLTKPNTKSEWKMPLQAVSEYEGEIPGLSQCLSYNVKQGCQSPKRNYHTTHLHWCPKILEREIKERSKERKKMKRKR